MKVEEWAVKYLLNIFLLEYQETCTNTAQGSSIFTYDFISKSQINEPMIPGTNSVSSYLEHLNNHTNLAIFLHFSTTERKIKAST